MFEYSHMMFEKKHDIFVKECTENGNIRGSYYTDGVIKLSMETWHDEILSIYSKLYYYKLSKTEINAITQYIKHKIDIMMNFKDGKPISTEPPNPIKDNYRAKLFTQVKTAILQGNQLLEDKCRANFKDAFRIYFPVILGILGSLIAALIGGIIL